MALTTNQVTDPTKKPAVLPSYGGFEMAGTPMANASAQPATQTFGTGNNLISTQINPGPSTRTQGLQGQADQALQTYGSTPMTPFQSIAPTDQTGTRSYLGTAAGQVNPSTQLYGMAGMGGTGSFGYAGDTGAVRGQLTGQLTNTLNNTPDRAKLAADAYSLIQERAQPQFEQDLRAVGQKAAALGRVGSGLTTNELGDVTTLHDRTLDQARRDLANNAASMSLSDQLNKVGAAQGVLGQLGGLDQGAGSLNLGYLNSANAERGNAFNRLYGLQNDQFGKNLQLAGIENQLAGQTRADQVGERNARQAYDNNLFDRNRSIFGDTADYANNAANWDRQNQGDLRGERNYQYGLSRDAQGDTVNQYGAQEGAYNTNFGQGADLWGLGNSYDPTGIYSQQAQNYQNQSSGALGGIGDLLSLYGNMRGGASMPKQPAALYKDYLSGINVG